MIRLVSILIIFSCACAKMQAQEIDITTIAGIDTFGYGGDGRPAINATFYGPYALCLDNFGNIYISDSYNNRIRKINLTTGIISTVAGIDTFGYSGDGGEATNAALWIPCDVCTDALGNVYIADGANNVIRKITVSTGIITTVAGNGTAGDTGDNELATNAELNGPVGVCLDKAGNIYIADYWNFKVRKVDPVTGIITTFAGNGTEGHTGDGGTATDAEFNNPISVFIDSVGNVYISDQYNNAIRKVDVSTGIITAFAGTGTVGYSGNGGPAIGAEINQPAGGHFDKKNNLFFADYGNHVIRKIDGVTGIITTVVGNGNAVFSGDGGPAIDAGLSPSDVVLDSAGIMYIADYDNNRIRMVYNTLGVKPITPSTEVAIYPNPAHDALVIENAMDNTVTVSNVLGQEVYKSTLSSNAATMDISGFANGVYVVQLFDPAVMSRVNKKIVKE